jgi:cell division septum initiation protein DivIVA
MAKKKVSKKKATVKKAPAKQRQNIQKVEAAQQSESNIRSRIRSFAAKQAAEFNKRFAK